MTQYVTYRTERTCCDKDAPVMFRTALRGHKLTSNGAWIRSDCCDKVHHAHKIDANEGMV